MGEMEQMENIYRAFLYCVYKVIQFSMSLQLSHITLWIQIVFAWKKFLISNLHSYSRIDKFWHPLVCRNSSKHSDNAIREEMKL